MHVHACSTVHAVYYCTHVLTCTNCASLFIVLWSLYRECILGVAYLEDKVIYRFCYTHTHTHACIHTQTHTHIHVHTFTDVNFTLTEVVATGQENRIFFTQDDVNSLSGTGTLSFTDTGVTTSEAVTVYVKVRLYVHIHVHTEYIVYYYWCKIYINIDEI